MKIPLVLAPQLWEKGPLEPFINPVSDYVSAMNAYDSYDGDMERDSTIIHKNEMSARDKARRAKAMFSQNDDDGNPINGYAPTGAEVPGTPDYIKKMANIPKSEYETILREDLAVWFGTKKKPKGSKQPKGPWVNICRKENGKHPPCGRDKAQSKGYPKCRAVHVASKMSDAEKKAACQQKRNAEKKDPKVGTGNKPTMTSYKPRKESITSIIRRVLKEQFDPERLYPVEEIHYFMSEAPRELKRIVKNLKPIPCVNDRGEKRNCYRIPEVIHVFMTGRY